MKTRCLLLFFASLCSAPVHAENDTAAPRRSSVMTVRGVGSYAQKPELARFDVVVATSGKTLDAAVEGHKDRATRALAALKQREETGLRIESSAFRIDEEKRPPYHPLNYPDEPAKLPPKISDTPFTARTEFHLTATRIDVLNEMVSGLASTGLFEFRKIDFKVDKERAALNQARRAAMADAREQAQAYAEAGELKLVEITDVTDGEARPSDLGAADMPLPRFVQIIPPAEVKFDATVNVTWRIAPH